MPRAHHSSQAEPVGTATLSLSSQGAEEELDSALGSFLSQLHSGGNEGYSLDEDIDGAASGDQEPSPGTPGPNATGSKGPATNGHAGRATGPTPYPLIARSAGLKRVLPAGALGNLSGPPIHPALRTPKPDTPKPAVAPSAPERPASAAQVPLPAREATPMPASSVPSNAPPPLPAPVVRPDLAPASTAFNAFPLTAFASAAPCPRDPEPEAHPNRVAEAHAKPAAEAHAKPAAEVPPKPAAEAHAKPAAEAHPTPATGAHPTPGHAPYVNVAPPLAAFWAPVKPLTLLTQSSAAKAAAPAPAPAPAVSWSTKARNAARAGLKRAPSPSPDAPVAPVSPAGHVGSNSRVAAAAPGGGGKAVTATKPATDGLDKQPDAEAKSERPSRRSLMAAITVAAVAVAGMGAALAWGSGASSALGQRNQQLAALQSTLSSTEASLAAARTQLARPALASAQSPAGECRQSASLGQETVRALAAMVVAEKAFLGAVALKQTSLMQADLGRMRALSTRAQALGPKFSSAVQLCSTDH